MKRTLSLANATRHIAQRQLHMLKVHYSVVQQTYMNHRAANAMSSMTATRKDKASVVNYLPVAAAQICLEDRPYTRFTTNVILAEIMWTTDNSSTG